MFVHLLLVSINFLFLFECIFYIEMDSLSLQGQTLLKTHPISSHAIGFLRDRKKEIVVIAQSKGIHMYNLATQKFEEEIKMSTGGSISCLTISMNWAITQAMTWFSLPQAWQLERLVSMGRLSLNLTLISQPNVLTFSW